ncbi:hypothetical protein NEHOM01_0103 [Nematocida homosporus]|uniref:uncharacterized protein n=1 Tax=Nematocida homosporus TaxID=1912981 RepID=UPI00222017E4|nr:uncharacterized protein NEHOM01_0103 [Nematocida homosporus]KAI5184358.1 hypothetical protein NEHOM01_0103 [Nematocida homosporus]
MSQWSRRRTGGLQRNHSLPLFFESISEEDQAREIKTSLECARIAQSGLKTINLCCLSIKNLPIVAISQTVRGEHPFSALDKPDYEQMLMQADLPVIINLEGNLIEAIPVELYSLLPIKGLFLRTNKLTKLSHKIAKLTNLTMLTLANNPIKYLPIELFDLPLTQFTISPNHFMTADEIERANSASEFSGLKSLKEICINEMGALKPLDILPIRTDYDQCRSCRAYTATGQPIYKVLSFRDTLIPFELIVCSLQCKQALLDGGS